MGRLSENSVVSIKNKSFSVTAEIDVPGCRCRGCDHRPRRRFGGWALYAKDGRAKFVYNVLGIQQFATEAGPPIPGGMPQVRMEFAYDGGGLAKGGDVSLYYDGDQVAAGRVETTQPMIFSADETAEIGYESGTTVTEDYTAQTSRFTGKLHWCSSTPAPTTTTTSSTQRYAFESPWQSSRQQPRDPSLPQRDEIAIHGRHGRCSRHDSTMVEEPRRGFIRPG